MTRWEKACRGPGFPPIFVLAGVLIIGAIMKFAGSRPDPAAPPAPEAEQVAVDGTALKELKAQQEAILASLARLERVIVGAQGPVKP